MSFMSCKGNVCFGIIVQLKKGDFRTINIKWMQEIFTNNSRFSSKTGRLESLLTSSAHFIKAGMIVMVSSTEY